MRQLFAIIASFALIFQGIPLTLAQGTGFDRARMTCIPVQQQVQVISTLECRITSPEVPYFLVAELGFPFQIAAVDKVSSPYSATMGMQYPAGTINGDGQDQTTLMFTALSWGDDNSSARMKPIPLHQMSFLVETRESMEEVIRTFANNQITLSLLSPNPLDPSTPLYQEVPVDTIFRFDSSLFMEAFTEYTSPDVLQFLQLGIACYQQTPQNCLANLIARLY